MNTLIVQNLNLIFIATKISTKATIFRTTKHEKTNLAIIEFFLIFPSLLAFSQQYKKSNRGCDIISYNFSFILAKTKSIQNDFYEVFVQISGKYKKYLAYVSSIYVSVSANVQTIYIK